jgi:hypothetical protein
MLSDYTRPAALVGDKIEREMDVINRVAINRRVAMLLELAVALFKAAAARPLFPFPCYPSTTFSCLPQD